ncbi:MAG TPA: vWA domain-containing protein [Vicinamibacterales bacterium]|nr:vWA domain-containing protein [Vicinamibacterales bacterium]
MTARSFRPYRDARVWLACGAVALAAVACDPGARRASRSDRREAREADAAPYQADVDEGLGAAVAILIDTSGSMRERAAGDQRPKHVAARGALEAMLDATDAFVARRPDFPIKIGIYSFSSSVRRLRPIEIYDRAGIAAALDELPRPGGGTAIGDAMRVARPDLYHAGVFRKYILVVTDGENTTGRSPDDVAREIWRKSEGAVQVYFVAFDTSPEKFAFLKEAGGDVLGAGTGAELQRALDGIYQGKILAEAPAAGEREPARR